MVTNLFLGKAESGLQAPQVAAESMVCAEGRVFCKFNAVLDESDCSLQKRLYLLAYYMLLLKNRSMLKEKNGGTFDADTADKCITPALVPMRIKIKKKKQPGVKSQPGGDHNGQRSNDCLLPGLPDDMALDCLARTSRSDYTSLAGLNRRFRQLIANGYLYKLRRQLGIVEHWVYVASSLMPWQAFDPTRQSWMRLPTMPCDDCFQYADKESLAVGTQLLVFGREFSGLAIWMYNVITRNWSRCRGMNLPRCLFGSGSLGEIAIVAGGSDMNGRVLRCAELYNSELGTWETLPDMNVPRKMCSGFFMDGKFYVIGGMVSNTESLTCGEEFDLVTRTWRRIPDMYPGGNRATQSPPLIAVVNNQLFAADQATNEVKRYDKRNNTWNFVRPLPVRADSYNGWGLAFKGCGDKLIVIGGHRGPRGEVIVLHSWCPEERNGGRAEWDVLSVRERAGAFVYNCAVMGC